MSLKGTLPVYFLIYCGQYYQHVECMNFLNGNKTGRILTFCLATDL